MLQDRRNPGRSSRSLFLGFNARGERMIEVLEQRVEFRLGIRLPDQGIERKDFDRKCRLGFSRASRGVDHRAIP